MGSCFLKINFDIMILYLFPRLNWYSLLAKPSNPQMKLVFDNYNFMTPSQFNKLSSSSFPTTAAICAGVSPLLLVSVLSALANSKISTISP